MSCRLIWVVTTAAGASGLDMLGSAAEAISANEAASPQGSGGRPSKSPASPDKHHKAAPAGPSTVSARALADAAVNATEGMQARPSPFGTEQQQQGQPGSRSPGKIGVNYHVNASGYRHSDVFIQIVHKYPAQGVPVLHW